MSKLKASHAARFVGDGDDFVVEPKPKEKKPSSVNGWAKRRAGKVKP